MREINAYDLIIAAIVGYGTGILTMALMYLT